MVLTGPAACVAWLLLSVDIDQSSFSDSWYLVTRTPPPPPPHTHTICFGGPELSGSGQHWSKLCSETWPDSCVFSQRNLNLELPAACTISGVRNQLAA